MNNKIHRKLVIVLPDELEDFLRRIKKGLSSKGNGKVRCICSQKDNNLFDITSIPQHFQKSKKCKKKREKLDIIHNDDVFIKKVEQLIYNAQNTENEVWKNLNGELREKKDIKDIYEVSSLGRVRNKFTMHLHKCNPNKDTGYCVCRLSTNEGKIITMKVHILIARTFLQKPDEKEFIDHINRIKTDNIVTNLRWVNRLENNKNRTITHKTTSVGQYDLEGKFIRIWESIKEASIELSIPSCSISSVCAKRHITAGGYKWEYVDKSYKEDLQGEIWKPIPNMENCLASNKGRINSKNTGKTYGTKSNSYMSVVIQKRNYRVHRLIALAFHGQPENKEMVIDHLNGIKNDNRPENLEWVEQKENAKRSKCIPIVQLNLDGTFKAEFRSATEAQEKTKIGQRHITDSCRGKRKSAGGYQWKYKIDYDKNSETQPYKSKRFGEPKAVIQLTMKGEFIKEFKTVADAETELDINKYGITRTCRGISKSIGGYQWKYKSDYDPHSPMEYKRSINSKIRVVVQLTNEGKFVREFKNATEASKMIGKNNQSRISRICREKLIEGISGGSKWMFKDDYEKLTKQ